MDSLSSQFYKAFVKNNRWMLYIKGLGSTLEVTLFAALLGLVLGTLACLFNMKRGRSGKRTVGSVIAYVYIDVIRGTPTMIQLLIMWNVIMAASKGKGCLFVKGIEGDFFNVAGFSRSIRARWRQGDPLD